MATRRYGFKYATVRENGILDPYYIPIEDDSLPYLLKYYHPIPETVTSFDDFQGKWYYDAEFTQEVAELNT